MEAMPTNLSMFAGDTGKEKKYSPLPNKNKKAEVASLVQDLVQQSRAVRRWEEGNWFIDTKYLLGDQWVTWDPRSLSLNVRAKKPWRIRQTINHLRPAVEIILNVITSNKPKLQCVPGSTEPSDRQSARACDKLLQYLWKSQEMDELLDEALMWMLVSGRGFLRVSWNPDAGKDVIVPDFDQLTEEMMLQNIQPPMKEVRTGDIATDVIPPFNMHVDPSATSIRKARWCGDETYMHVDEAKVRWPEHADDIHPDGGNDVYYSYIRRLLFINDSKATTKDIQDTVTIRTLYIRDGKDIRKIVTAGATVLEDVPSPFGELFPYVDLLCFRNPGSYWGQGLVNLARNAQTSFNRSRSSFMEMMNKTGNPQWLVAKGSGVKREDLTDEPGGVIYYNPIGVAPVQQIPGAQPPPGWQQLMGLDLGDMRDQMGILDVLRGDNPPGVRSGRSLAYLVEQNLGRHGPMIRRFERSVQDLGRLWLAIAQKFYAEDRLLAVAGEDSGVDIFKLKQADLHTPQDVVINVGSALPESKVQRQDFILSLWQQGLLVDDMRMPDPGKAMELLEFANERDVYDSGDSDKQWAMEENERMARGEPLMPELHDNHPAHAKIHVAFMRTSRYRRLPPEIKQIFRQHLDAHIQVMQQDASLAGPPPEEEMAPAGGGEGGGGEGISDGEPRTDLRGGPV